jgi:putative PIN family toxin of toxin-antitoxin system
MSRRSRKKDRLLSRRVVIDTNTLLSGVLSPRKAAGQIIRLWKAGKLQLYVNQDIIDEYLRILGLFVDDVTLKHWKIWLSHPRNISVVHTYLPKYSELRDPTDNPFLAAAVFAEANYLISRDKDLLVLKKFHELKIVKPEEFMRLYKQGK